MTGTQWAQHKQGGSVAAAQQAQQPSMPEPCPTDCIEACPCFQGRADGSCAAWRAPLPPPGLYLRCRKYLRSRRADCMADCWVLQASCTGPKLPGG